MSQISLDLIRSTWHRLCKDTPQNRQTLKSEFLRQQPVIWALVRQQDQDWFPNKPAKIGPLCMFVWLVFLTAYSGRVPSVTDNQLCAVMESKMEKMDLIDVESEIQGHRIADELLRRHPQFLLSTFILDVLTAKEDNYDLIPTETRATHEYVDVVIRALDLAVSTMSASEQA